MSDKSKIEWTDATWYVPSWNCVVVPDPLRWRRPRRARVRFAAASDGDLFADGVTDVEIDCVFAVMALSPQHTFQILTKRPERMRAYMSDEMRTSWRVAYEMAVLRGDRMEGSARSAAVQDGSGWPIRNVWLGVSVEDQRTANERIPLLLQTPAAVRFVSYEPAIGPVEFQMLRGGEMLDREGAPYLDALRGATYWPEGDHGCNTPRLDGIIVGGESGPGARPCDIGWIRSTVRQCAAAGVACFVKQLGARPFVGDPVSDDVMAHHGSIALRRTNGHLRDHKGADPAEWPEDLRVRQLPGQVEP